MAFSIPVSSVWFGVAVAIVSIIVCPLLQQPRPTTCTVTNAIDTTQAVLLFVFILAYYYASDRESSAFAKSIFIIGVVLVLFCVFLVPLDIYNTSHTPLELVVERARYISIAYYSISQS
jgi:hypothetical protein